MEKTMKLTNEEMSGMKLVIEHYQEKLNGMNTYIDPRIAYLFGRNHRILRSQLQDYEEQEEILLRQYGSIKQDKNDPKKTYYSINRTENPENFDTFKQEHNKLLNIEHEVTLFTEDFSSFDHPFNFKDLCCLWFLMSTEN